MDGWVRSDSPPRRCICTRCRYAEIYRDLGLGALGAFLSCNRDGAFCEGYDSRLELTRTQTIMSGAWHCNFRYRWRHRTGSDSRAEGPARGPVLQVPQVG